MREFFFILIGGGIGLFLIYCGFPLIGGGVAGICVALGESDF